MSNGDSPLKVCRERASIYLSAAVPAEVHATVVAPVFHKQHKHTVIRNQHLACGTTQCSLLLLQAASDCTAT
jgi:hypothetical protein